MPPASGGLAARAVVAPASLPASFVSLPLADHSNDAARDGGATLAPPADRG
jgi:hypothetical protein